jgi:hypothetical protein
MHDNLTTLVENTARVEKILKLLPDKAWTRERALQDTSDKGKSVRACFNSCPGFDLIVVSHNLPRRHGLRRTVSSNIGYLNLSNVVWRGQNVPTVYPVRLIHDPNE